MTFRAIVRSTIFAAVLGYAVATGDLRLGTWVLFVGVYATWVTYEEGQS